jgi:uncharacterized secreted protein with C-terminal beta-propeller domain
MLRRLVPVLFATLAVACSNSNDSKPTSQSGGQAPAQTPNSQTPAATDSTADAQRVIAEADIIQLANGRLYAIAKSGTLSVIDVSVPNQLTILGEAFVGGNPFEMYLNGDRVVLLMDSDAGAQVFALDVHDPAIINRTGSWTTSGAISDSRLVGDLLYLVTSNAVTSINVSGQTAPNQTVDHVAIPNGDNTEKKSVLFGNGRMYVGGQSGIDMVDVSDASGKLALGAHVDAGPIFERWQMSEKDDVLRVVVQDPASQNVLAETFQVWNPRSVQAIAKTPMTGIPHETLKAVRFDGDRAYAITYQAIVVVQVQYRDPLFIIDFSQGTPTLHGQVQMPGYIVEVEPRGNRLVGFGVDPLDNVGDLNVSLFDVTDMDAPRQMQRVSFGNTTNVPEDQDRLQKAFRIGADGMITVPYPAPAGSACQSGGGIQLVKLDNDVLYPGAKLEMAGNPRRAIVNQDQLIGVSDSNVTAFQISTRTQTADLVIGTCTDIQATTPVATMQPVDEYDDGELDTLPCSMSRRVTHPGAAGLIVLGIAIGAVARRRRS